MLNNEIHRILDANINRASEALRVLEDWTRYAKNCLSLSEKLKNIRHEINSLFSSMHFLTLSRNSEFDVGKDLENKFVRTSVKDILKANCKRLEESLRALSEYGQLLNINTKKLEYLRYEVYSVEKNLLINEKYFRLQNASLYLVTTRKNQDGALCTDSEFLTVVEKAIEGGVNIIQLREKEESERKIIGLAEEIKKLIAKTEILFIINDRVDIALACGADGVHLGQGDMPVSSARQITPSGFLIGLSTHSIEQGLAAINSMSLPDYLGVGPVFKTPTKPDYIPAGLQYVEWAHKNLNAIPWFAIGGIDESNIDKVISRGAEKVAVVRSIMNAKDTLKVTKELKELLVKGKVPNASTVK